LVVLVSWGEEIPQGVLDPILERFLEVATEDFRDILDLDQDVGL
jgi:hypothetical protein